MPQVLFKGSGAAYVSLISGEVSVAFSTVLSAIPHVKSGRIRALGVTTKKRVSVLPDVPTIAEAGVPGYTFSTWYGTLAPAATPPAIINALNDHIVKAVRGPELGKRFSYEGAEAIASSPAQFAAHIKSELARWEKVVKESEGLRAD
jgi:tripartite-type tricarboxylate transporter receptor subunit TctC